jgi:tetratricopeptide (TPR) repeat protein
VPQIILKKSRRWQQVILAAVAVCLLVAVIVLIVILLGALKHSNVEAQAKQLDANKQYKDEINLLENYVNSNPPEQYLEGIAAQLGDIAYRSVDYRAAYRWDLRAWTLEGSKPKLVMVVNVAQTAALSGDEATAISFYRQAIALVPAQPPITHDAQVTQYQNIISGLASVR